MRHSAAGMLHQLGLHRFCSCALDAADIRSPVGSGSAGHRRGNTDEYQNVLSSNV